MNLKLGTKLLMILLAISIIPFGILSGLSVWKSSRALQEQAYKQLEIARENKKTQIKDLFAHLSERMAFVAAIGSISDHLVEFESIAKDTELGFASREYQAAYNDYHKSLANYAAGFADMYLIANDGLILYSVAKKTDFGKHLKNDSSVANSGLAKAHEAALKGGKPAFEDFSLYGPADGEPAAFFAYPLVDGKGAVIGILAFRIDSSSINRIMSEKSGMANSADLFLVGPDRLMRSDSHHDKENYSVKASLANPSKGSADVESVQAALAGKTGTMLTRALDGENVIASFAPVEVGNTLWALITEANIDETFAAVQSLKILIGIIAISTLIMVGLVSLFAIRSITRPLGGEPARANA